VLIAFKHMPLPKHEFAITAAEAAECSRRMGRFWPMHDLLFEHQEALDAKNVRSYAASVGLDLRQFDSCMSNQAQEAVMHDVQSAKTLEITGTPSFFVGTRTGTDHVSVVDRLAGARPLEDFHRALDKALSHSLAARQ
jgi:protein-disulfide isomerase